MAKEQCKANQRGTELIMVITFILLYNLLPKLSIITHSLVMISKLHCQWTTKARISEKSHQLMETFFFYVDSSLGMLLIIN